MLKFKSPYRPLNKSVVASVLISTFLITCDKERDMHEFKKYNYGEGTVLTFSSAFHTEEFIVQRVVNGNYEDSRSGTCGKSPMTVYEYQAVYLKPVDSVDRWMPMIGPQTNDCSRYPQLYQGQWISSFNGTYNPLEYDRINWLDEFYGYISEFRLQHPRITLVNRSFTNVFEYEVTTDKRLATIYYSHRQGFVGYALKNGEVFELTNP